MNSIEIIVRIIAKKTDKVLLCINKKTGNYYLPGGHLELGDTLEKTIYKETDEELGWKKEDIKSISFKTYLENFYTKSDESTPRHELNMIFDVKINENTTIQSKEPHIDFEWIELSRIDNLPIVPSTIIRFIT